MTLVIPDLILVIPAKAGIHTDSPQNHTARCPPGLVIPEKAEIHRWRWTPAFAGITTSEHGNELLEFCDGVLRDPLHGGEDVKNHFYTICCWNRH
ncbi:hypothetical protein [Endozoicomonas sp. 8E]|uniref:hypothetical protein n=1 Tax=Endozoicomonas sp. 8E TaxID=3035692 RepID=UPI0029390E8A|nr:hypothetical protein [Endozoicomonas sp. 8E]WOG28115.1 hypothetical protein P6910_00220 [Endozoicomonas sp. 8E]